MIKRFLSCFSLSKRGFEVENLVHQHLISHEINVFREKDIKKHYGMNISGIDHMYFTHHFCTNQIQYVLIQTKYYNKPVSIKDCHHFIKCCYDIYHLEKGLYSLTCIMLSKNGLSKPSKKSFQDENIKQKQLSFIDINGVNSDEMIYNLNTFLTQQHLLFSTKNKKRKLSHHYFKYIKYPSCKRIKYT